MKNKFPIFIEHTAMITSLGEGCDENLVKLEHSISGIDIVQDAAFFDMPLPMAKIPDELIQNWRLFFKTESRFDTILLACVDQFKKKCKVELSSSDVQFILSSTKGNIELLRSNKENKKVFLSYSASLLQKCTGNPNKPLIISNACISGVSATLVAKRLLESGQCKHVFVIGCDVLSKFVLSGFNSFHALSKDACRPFDKYRNGVTLGEAVACYLMSRTIESEIIVEGGCISNDANHISGPSKTGEELAYCIQQSLSESELDRYDLDMISAHGTATVYNDEMESKAFELSGLQKTPAFSLKGHYGHTLGAAGVLEIASCCMSEKTNHFTELQI